MKSSIVRSFFHLLFFFSFQFPQAFGVEIYQDGFLTIEEARQSIELPDGFSLELVLSEPQI
ncbi:MAG: hypothetical protein ACKVJ1_07165, partial [Verrucomicrobiia bacterium]